MNKDIPPLLIIMADSEQENPPILRHANLFADSMKRIGKTDAEISVTPRRRHMTAMSKMAEPGDPEFLRVVDFIRKHER